MAGSRPQSHATPLAANTCIHLVWDVERVSDQVHYISLTVGDQTYNIDTYYSAQPNWTWKKSMRLFRWMETMLSSLTTYGSTRSH